MEAKKMDSKIEIAKRKILEKFSFLEKQYGYKPSCITMKEKPFLERLKVEYINEAKGRSVNVSCTKGDVYNEIIYTLNASISRIPYETVEDFFSLSQFLQTLGKDFPTTLRGEFTEEEVILIIDQLVSAIIEHTLDIVTGTSWLRDYYPKRD